MQNLCETIEVTGCDELWSANHVTLSIASLAEWVQKHCEKIFAKILILNQVVRVENFVKSFVKVLNLELLDKWDCAHHGQPYLLFR